MAYSEILNPQPVSAAALPLPAGAAISANQQTNAITDTQIRATPLTVTMVNTLALTDTQLRASPVPVANSVLTATGSLTAAAQAVTLVLGGRYANATIQVSGTYVGTLVFEASNDGFTTAPTTINALRAGDNTISQQISDSASNDIYRCTVAGFNAIRLRANVLTSGSAVVNILATESTSGVFLNFPIPTGGNTIGAVNVNGTVPVSGTFFQATQAVSGTFFQATQPVSGTVAANATLSAETTKVIGTVNVAGTVPVSGAFFQTTQPVSGAFFQATQPVSGTFFQATQPVSLATNTPVLAAGTAAIGNINELRASSLAVTGTAAAATALTITLPAVAAQFHYITSINILLYSSAARTGAAAPNVVTTTNIPGAVAFTFSTAGAIGATDLQDFSLVTPLKSTTVNTATTIVAPIAAGGIWRVTVTYFTAP